MRLEQAGLLKRMEGAVLVDGLEGAAAEFEAHIAAEFRNEDALALKIGRNLALYDLSHVTADTAFFLGQTGAVDSAARADAGSSDDTNTGHGLKFVELRGAKNGDRARPVKTNRV